MLSSSKTVADSWEIHLYGRPNLRMSVAECGLFRSEDEALRVGAMVRTWLQLGVFGEALRAAMPDQDDQLSLFALPEVLRGLGHDPARVLVTVGRADDDGVRYDRPVTVEAWREDAGHAPRGAYQTRVEAESR